MLINFCVFTGGGNLELCDVDRCDTDLSPACVPGEGHGYFNGCYRTCCLSLKGDRCTQGWFDLDTDRLFWQRNVCDAKYKTDSDLQINRLKI